ncbi:hypothetical protein HZC07_00785 [Candidatus Micrarchaeota archaeon]|nr:hypothetical protein [Candidatus Micrarchaeota archaeon]
MVEKQRNEPLKPAELAINEADRASRGLVDVARRTETAIGQTLDGQIATAQKSLVKFAEQVDRAIKAKEVQKQSKERLGTEDRAKILTATANTLIDEKTADKKEGSTYWYGKTALELVAKKDYELASLAIAAGELHRIGGDGLIPPEKQAEIIDVLKNGREEKVSEFKILLSTVAVTDEALTVLEKIDDPLVRRSANLALQMIYEGRTENDLVEAEKILQIARAYYTAATTNPGLKETKKLEEEVTRIVETGGEEIEQGEKRALEYTGAVISKQKSSGPLNLQSAYKKLEQDYDKLRKECVPKDATAEYKPSTAFLRAERAAFEAGKRARAGDQKGFEANEAEFRMNAAYIEMVEAYKKLAGAPSPAGLPPEIVKLRAVIGEAETGLQKGDGEAFRKALQKFDNRIKIQAAMAELDVLEKGLSEMEQMYKNNPLSRVGIVGTVTERGIEGVSSTSESFFDRATATRMKELKVKITQWRERIDKIAKEEQSFSSASYKSLVIEADEVMKQGAIYARLYDRIELLEQERLLLVKALKAPDVKNARVWYEGAVEKGIEAMAAYRAESADNYDLNVGTSLATAVSRRSFGAFGGAEVPAREAQAEKDFQKFAGYYRKARMGMFENKGGDPLSIKVAELSIYAVPVHAPSLYLSNFATGQREVRKLVMEGKKDEAAKVLEKMKTDAANTQWKVNAALLGGGLLLGPIAPHLATAVFIGMEIDQIATAYRIKGYATTEEWVKASILPAAMGIGAATRTIFEAVQMAESAGKIAKAAQIGREATALQHLSFGISAHFGHSGLSAANEGFEAAIDAFRKGDKVRGYQQLTDAGFSFVMGVMPAYHVASPAVKWWSERSARTSAIERIASARKTESAQSRTTTWESARTAIRTIMEMPGRFDRFAFQSPTPESGRATLGGVFRGLRTRVGKQSEAEAKIIREFNAPARKRGQREIPWSEGTKDAVKLMTDATRAGKPITIEEAARRVTERKTGKEERIKELEKTIEREMKSMQKPSRETMEAVRLVEEGKRSGRVVTVAEAARRIVEGDRKDVEPIAVEIPRSPRRDAQEPVSRKNERQRKETTKVTAPPKMTMPKSIKEFLVSKR